MRISTETLELNAQKVATIDPKIQKLIKSLVDKPLLLEKIIVNQQGSRLNLASGAQKLQLQLPPAANNRLNQLAHQPQITLSLNKQTLIITINPQLKQSLIPENKDKPSKKQPLFSDPKLAGQSNNQQVSTSQTLVFRQAIVLSNQPLSLALKGLTLNPSARAPAAQIPNDIAETKQANIAQKMVNQPASSSANNTQANSNPTGRRSGTALSPATTKASIAKAVTGQLTATQSRIDLSTLAKSLIQPNYNTPKTLSTQLQHLSQQLQSIEQQNELEPSLKQALQPIKALMQSLKLADPLTAKGLKQRLSNSGLFFEHKAQSNASPKTTMAIQQIKQQLKQPSTQFAAVELTLKPMQQKPQNRATEAAGNTIATHDVNSSNRLAETEHRTLDSSKDLKLNLIKIVQSLQKLLNAASSVTFKDTEIIRAQLNNSADSGKQNPSQLAAAAAKNASNQLNTNDLSQNKEPNKNSPDTQHFNRDNVNRLTPPQLPQQLQNQLREMLSEVKGMLSQLETHQLMSVKSEHNGIQQYLFDLPLLKNSQIDSFELRFRQNKQTNTQAKANYWKVVVRFDLEPLGPMFAQVELKNERLSTHIFAQSSDTAILIDSHLHVLRDSLTEAGIQTDTLSANQGHVPETLLEQQRQGVDIRI